MPDLEKNSIGRIIYDTADLIETVSSLQSDIGNQDLSVDLSISKDWCRATGSEAAMNALNAIMNNL